MTILATTDPVTDPIPEPPQETYEQFRERFLLHWCREKSIHDWCGEFDSIMIRNLGYTAKEVREAVARYDYHHAATATFTSNHEMTKAETKNVVDRLRHYLREYFDVENSAITAALELVSAPEAEAEMTELQREKARVLKTILDNRYVRPSTELTILQDLGYTPTEIEAARTAGRWTYRLSLSWHCQHRISYPGDVQREIGHQIVMVDGGLIVANTEITPGTTRELN